MAVSSPFFQQFLMLELNQKRKNPIFQIQTHKVEIHATSKVGSLNNVKHKPGGGEKKIFDDKDYLKNIEHPVTPSQPSQVTTP